jgi:hypothetical protein
MTRIEALAIAAPLVVAAALGLFGLATNYFDDKATAKRAAAKAAGRDAAAGNPLDRELTEARTGSRALLAAAVKQLDALNRLEARSAARTTSPRALEPVQDGGEKR